MDDPGLEEKFTADVDRLLREGEPEEGNSPAGDYSQMVNTARELADLDLSPQSRIQTSLRRRLMAEWDAKARSRPKKNILFAWFSKRTVQLAFVLLIAVGIALLVGLPSENAVHTVYGRISELFRIGVPTYAVQTVPESSSQYRTPGAIEESVAYWDMHWRYITLYGTMGTRKGSAIEGGTK